MHPTSSNMLSEARSQSHYKIWRFFFIYFKFFFLLVNTERHYINTSKVQGQRLEQMNIHEAKLAILLVKKLTNDITNGFCNLSKSKPHITQQ